MQETINQPDISVVIPTHNRPGGLANSLSSIVKQTQLPYEVVVVDDGSVPAVDESIFDHFPDSVKCCLLRNETAKGGNNARNQGILAASGEFIAFLDDDDKFKPKKIEVLACEIAANPDADVLYHPAHIHMPNEGISYFSKPYRFGKGNDVFRTLLVQNRIGGTPMVTVRKQALLEVGLLDEEMPALQDYELWLRLAKKGYRFLLVDQPLTDYYYITKQGSVSKSIDINAKAISLIEKKYIDEYAELGAAEKKQYEVWKKKKMIHKSLLNGNVRKAIGYQFDLLKYSPSLVNLASLIVMLFGPKAVFKLKAKIG